MKHEHNLGILVVDDEASNLYIINRILKDDYAVYAARSGEAALKIARERKPALILLDLLMPGMSGFETLAALKENEETQNIPVIIITGLNSAADEQEGFRLGAADYITKPFNTAVVKARIERQLKVLSQLRTAERFNTIDALTGLSNRRGFDQQIDHAWKEALEKKTPLTLLMIDVDKFKHINDHYGHPQGDKLLKEMAAILREALQEDDMAFRWGGDEFAIVLPEMAATEAMLIAKRIRAKVEETIFLNQTNDERMFVTVSIGVACASPEEDMSAAQLMAVADKALYAAKASGRNRVVSIS